MSPGQKVTLYYADFDGREDDVKWRVNQELARKDFAIYGQYDEFISAGSGVETFENVFNYHAFRFVLIEGLEYLPDNCRHDRRAR